MKKATLVTKPRTSALLIKEHSCRLALGGFECGRLDQRVIYILYESARRRIY